ETRRALVGRSLLAAPAPMRDAVPITNCTALFPCPINTWGLLRDGFALHAQHWDGDWRCFALGSAKARGAADRAGAPLREARGVARPLLRDAQQAAKPLKLVQRSCRPLRSGANVRDILAPSKGNEAASIAP